jgi:hypothetical protein
MGARELTIEKGETLSLAAAEASMVRILKGDVWLTQHADAADHMLTSGASVELNQTGATLVKAYETTLLEIYRADRAGVREWLERAARRARAAALYTFLTRIFA